MEERVAEAFNSLEDTVNDLMSKAWRRVRPYVMPVGFLLVAVVLVWLFFKIPASAEAKVIGLSVLAGALILSATLLLMAQWYFKRKE